MQQPNFRRIDSFGNMFFFTAAVICFVLINFATFSRGQAIRFREVTTEMGTTGWLVDGVSSYGHGVSFADISGDGLPDLYIAQAVRGADSKLPETLYISHQGGPYSEEDGKRGVSDAHGMTGTHGISVVDYDNDGDYDIFNATTDDRIRVYHNIGDGYYNDFTETAKMSKNMIWLPTYGEIGYGTRGLVAFDANNDGYMDILGVNWGPVEDKAGNPWPTPPQPNEFYINNGNGTFTKDDSRGLTPVNPTHVGTQGVTAVDVDNDGDVDVFVCHRNYAHLGNDEYGAGSTPAPNELFINDGNGFYTNETNTRGMYFDKNDINAATWADFDNDGDMDVFLPPAKSNQNFMRIMVNDGQGNFGDHTNTHKIPHWGFACFLFDVENDGDLDLYVPRTREQSKLFLNNGNGTFAEMSGSGLNVMNYDPRGGGVADIDNDGDLDIYYVDANKDADPAYSNHLFRNDTYTTNRWLKVEGRGPKGDMAGFGTRIWVFESGGMDDMDRLVGYKQVLNTYSYLCQDDPVQHFGLGQRDEVDVKVAMLDGTVLKATSVAARTRIYFAKPTQLVKFGGDNQKGVIGEKLLQPFRVKVTDASGTVLHGAAVTFTPTGTNGMMAGSMPVYTDVNGVAEAFYYLGTEPTQQVQATLDATPGVYTNFTVESESSGPVLLEYVKGADQSALVGTVLADSIKVCVKDGAGIGQPDHPVLFEIIAGNGLIKPGDVAVKTVKTNSTGHAAVAWQLGPSVNDMQQLRISSEKINGSPLVYSPLIISATPLEQPIQAGPPRSITVVSGNNQTGIVGTDLPNPFVVQLVDSAGNPCVDYYIQYQVIEGNGRIDALSEKTVKTDGLGLASVVLSLGPSAGLGNNKVTAKYPALATVLTFSASALADVPAKLVKYSDGDRQSGGIGQTLARPLRAAVTDRYGNPIVNHPVIFAVTSSDGWVNNAKTVTVMTDVSGVAKVSLKLGDTPGIYTISASAEYLGTSLEGSPATFRATAISKPAFLTYVAGDSTNGLINQSLGIPLMVKVTDESGYAIPNHAVTFVVRRGGGTFNEQLEITKITDSGGVASVYPILGNTPGYLNNVFEAQAFGEGGQNLQGSPVRFHVTAKKTMARKLIKISGDDQTSQAGEFLPNFLKVVALNVANQPVQAQDIKFSVVQGGGNLGKYGSSQVIIKTSSNGMASVDYQLGLELGDRKHVVKVEADDGVFALENTPLFFHASALYGRPDSILSSVTATSPVNADGVSQSVVRITLMDAAKNPVPGERVTLLVSGDGNSIQQPMQPTDASGTTVGYVRSNKAENKIITALVTYKNIFLTQTASVVFTPGPVNRLLITAGNFQRGVINSALSESLVVCVYDAYNNPIPYALVYFIPQSGGGRIEQEQPVVTDENGEARANWVLGPTIGKQEVLVRVVNLSETSVFEAHAEAPMQVQLLKVKGDEQFTVPGSAFKDSLVVRAVDERQSPIFGINVTFTVLQGDANVSGSSTVKSDVFGLAKVHLLAGSSLGAVRVEARVNKETAVQFSESIAGSIPQHLTIVYGNGLRDRVGSIIFPLSARVTDGIGGVVANVPVTFTSNTVGGEVIDPQPAKTDDNGLVSVCVKLGIKAGTYIFKATASGLHGSPAIFALYALPDKPAQIEPDEGDQQEGRGLEVLVNPVRIKLSDQFGNGVSGMPIDFQVTSGNGKILEDSPLNTDVFGLASVRWQLGTVGSQILTATCNVLPGKQAVFSARLIENIPPLITAVSDTFIYEKQTLVFSVTARDPDGDAADLTLSAENLPQGANFDPIYSNLFDWKPNFNQQGVHEVVFMARDLNGGETRKTVKIRVKNLNRPPVITGFLPAEYYLTSEYYKALTFSVNIQDADNDTISYTWMLNGLTIGHDSSQTIMPNPSMRSEFELKVIISDGYDIMSHAWSVKVVPTLVEIEIFEVESNGRSNTVRWRCSNEVNHSGFYVLRSEHRDETYERINASLIISDGSGHYQYNDEPDVLAERYYYKLEAIDRNGHTQVFGPVEAVTKLPGENRLCQNYPNPFNPETIITYEIVGAQRVEMKIFNIFGQLVKSLYNGPVSAGYHRITWDGRTDSGMLAPSGIYYGLLLGEDFRHTIKLIFIK